VRDKSFQAVTCIVPAVYSEQFRWDLKTYLFAGHSKRWHIRGVNVIVLYKLTFTYLLTYLFTYIDSQTQQTISKIREEKLKKLTKPTDHVP